MKIEFTTHNLELTEALEQRANDKLQRFSKLLERATSFHVNFTVDKIRQIADASIHVPGHHFQANAESDDMYKTIDMLADKLEKQIVKHKEKEHNHR